MNEITITLSVGQPYGDQVRDCKRRIVLHALGSADWNVKSAARRLGIDRTNLYRIMRDLSIVVPRASGGVTERVDEVFDDLVQRLQEREVGVSSK